MSWKAGSGRLLSHAFTHFSVCKPWLLQLDSKSLQLPQASHDSVNPESGAISSESHNAIHQMGKVTSALATHFFK